MIKNLINECNFSEQDLNVLKVALETDDYNLMRVIVEGTISDLENEIKDKLLKDKLNIVNQVLPEYKSLLKLDSIIMESI
jgi:hypothetical protein